MLLEKTDQEIIFHFKFLNAILLTGLECVQQYTGHLDRFDQPKLVQLFDKSTAWTHASIHFQHPSGPLGTLKRDHRKINKLIPTISLREKDCIIWVQQKGNWAITSFFRKRKKYEDHNANPLLLVLFQAVFSYENSAKQWGTQLCREASPSERQYSMVWDCDIVLMICDCFQ